MYVRTLAALATSVLLAPSLAVGQTIPGDVTFEVPINLTRLDPAITRVRVVCVIYSTAIPGHDRRIRGAPAPAGLAGNLEIPVSSGRVVTTANVVVRISPTALKDPAGKSANYECSIGAALRSGDWWWFGNDQQVPAPFRMASPPQSLTGTFMW